MNPITSKRPNRDYRGENSAIGRAMREMGYEPGNELTLPSQSFLDEKGMTQDEFMDSVHNRADELYIRPIQPRGLDRIELGNEEPEMYFNGGRFGNPINRAMRKARRQSRRRDKSLLSEELNRRYEEVGASQMMEEMAGIYPSREAEFNKWYEENLPQIKENAYKEEISRRKSRDGGRRSQNRYNEKVRSEVGTGEMLSDLSNYYGEQEQALSNPQNDNRKFIPKALAAMGGLAALGGLGSSAYGRVKADRLNSPQYGDKIKIKDVLREMFNPNN